MNKKEFANELTGIVIGFLSDRRGFDDWFENIDKEIQDEILEELSEEICEFLKYEDDFDQDVE